MTGHPRMLLALAEPRGALDLLEETLSAHTDDVDAIALVGPLTAPSSKPETYRAIFKLLGRSGLPAYWVPGAADAPLRDYLGEAHGAEIAFPSLRGVHGTIAAGPGDLVFAGMGGEIVDTPHTIRDEELQLRYPAWEAEYRLKVIRELKPHTLVFLLGTPPAHKGLGDTGSEVLAELVKTYDPAVVVVGGEEPAEETLGKSLVVAPGRLDRGNVAIVDIRERSVERIRSGAVTTHP